MPIYHAPRQYEQHLTSSGRARTIAAFHIAQGDVDRLGTSDMRRDVLLILMSKSAINHWLDQKWLERSGSIGKIKMLRLTSMGLQTCSNSLSGLAHVNTDPESVANKRRLMTQGGSGHTKTELPDLPAVDLPAGT